MTRGAEPGRVRQVLGMSLAPLAQLTENQLIFRIAGIVAPANLPLCFENSGHKRYKSGPLAGPATR